MLGIMGRMVKLVILIEKAGDPRKLDEHWPEFLRLAEQMPGLQRETTSRTLGSIYGMYDVALTHELYFESQEALQSAMTSPTGEAAGRMLQWLTDGRMTLFYASHHEDELANIRPYTSGRAEGDA
jgi:uncharacterized protein (TIGR02118 family)